jgi:hypothetical protein
MTYDAAFAVSGTVGGNTIAGITNGYSILSDGLNPANGQLTFPSVTLSSGSGSLYVDSAALNSANLSKATVQYTLYVNGYSGQTTANMDGIAFSPAPDLSCGGSCSF